MYVVPITRFKMLIYVDREHFIFVEHFIKTNITILKNACF